LSNTIEFEGQTEQEAVSKACAALKLPEADLDYTMLDEGSAGVFGLGARPVRIRVRAPEGSDGMRPTNHDQDDDEERGGIVGPAPEKAAKALEVAKGLADRMGLSAKIDVRDEHEQIVVVIEEVEGGSDVAETLGKSRPPAIPSFQFLLNKIVNRFPTDRKHIVVEVPSVPRKERREGRRQEPREQQPRSERRQEPVELDPNLDPTLVAIGRFLAERAQQLNKVITVHPMLPSDRRAVHQTITSISGVHTVSEGEGLYRRMHVVPDSMREGGGNGKRRRRRRRRGRGRGREDGGSGESAPTDSAEADTDPEIETAEV
jgi:spoIIIJ-associated protein